MENKQRYLKIGGELVPVTEEVYLEYMRPWWKEKKCRILRSKKEWSYEKMQMDDKDFEIADDCIIEKIVEDKLILETLATALEILSEDERNMLDSLFFQGLSERELSAKTGVPRKTIAYRKDKILSKLKIFIEKH